MLGRNIAIQGEIIGPRIQGNKYKRAQQEFYVFDIYDIDKQEYLRAAERIQLCQELGLLHVPTPAYYELFECAGLELLSLDVVLEAAEGKSMLCDTQREGLVFKHLDDQLSFKAISNKFLLKNE
jgi:ATP-dependent RNA circularization protein (DNA/RNA ligase family)